MTIKCSCSDRLDKSNAEELIRRVEYIIKNEISPFRFREPQLTRDATEYWKNAIKMLEDIKKLPDCKQQYIN